MKGRILSLVQLPPPVHGASVMNEIAVSFFDGSSDFENYTIVLKFSRTLSDLRKPSLYKFFSVFIIFFKVFQQLTLRRPNLVYFTLTPTGSGFIRDCLYVFLIKMFGVKLVYHLHGKGVSDYARKSLIIERLYRIVFRNEKVILLASELYQDISKYVDVRDVIIVPNGIDCADERIERHVGFDGIVKFCFLSNLVKGKGILDFLEAFYELYRVGKNVKAVVIGGYREDGTELLVDEFLYSKGVEFSTCVKFKGPMYGVEKISTLSSSDVFVFPTYIDTFPLVLIEAMANGLPCIAYDEGATSSMIGEMGAGYIVEKGRCDLLSQAMQKFVDSPQLISEMSVNARTRYESEYTQSQFEKRIAAAILLVLNSKD